MARQARIIRQVTDTWGDLWDVRELRATAHGFEVMLGWPANLDRGQGGAGGPRVIVTEELGRHFEEHRSSMSQLSLPIGNTAIKRVRKLLGHHRQLDRAAWWEFRADDLAELTIDTFADRHGVSVGAVVNARHALFGPQLRPAHWWRADDVAQILLLDAPQAEIAEKLGISVGSVRRLRSIVKKDQSTPLRSCPPSW